MHAVLTQEVEGCLLGFVVYFLPEKGHMICMPGRVGVYEDPFGKQTSASASSFPNISEAE